MNNLFTNPEKLLVHGVRNNGGEAIRRMDSNLKDPPIALCKSADERNHANAHLLGASPQLYQGAIETLRYVRDKAPEMAELPFIQSLCDAVTQSHAILQFACTIGIKRVEGALEIHDDKLAFFERMGDGKATPERLPGYGEKCDARR